MGNTLQKMSCMKSAGAVKSEREAEQQVEEEDELPLMLPAMVKSHLDTLVCAQLCNPQGVALFSFVRLSPRVFHPFAGARVYDMSLTHAERLCVVGCGFKGRLVRLLSLGVGHHFEPQRNWSDCHQMMQISVRHVAAGSAAAVRDEAAKEAEELCASGQCAAAAVPLQRAIRFGDLNSRALKAWLLIHGREGVAVDENRAFELAEEGARLGSHYCQGVLAWCYLRGFGCRTDAARSLELARESSGRGSKYGQFMLAQLHEFRAGGLAGDDAQALVFYGLAAAQGLDWAQCELGDMHKNAVAQDYVEALRLYQLAAAQGLPRALSKVAHCHEKGLGVAADAAEAIRWYMRAQAAGNIDAQFELERLRGGRKRGMMGNMQGMH